MMPRRSSVPEITQILIKLLGLYLGIGILTAHANTVSQTQTRLQQLQTKINQLQKNLNQAQDKHTVLVQELAVTQQLMNTNLLQLGKIKRAISAIEGQINSLEQRMGHLNQKLSTQQATLGQFIRARYQIGTDQPLRIILNRDKPKRAQRLLTYYQYLIRDQQRMVNEVRTTQNKLRQAKEILQLKLVGLNKLQHQLLQQKQQYDANQRYHNVLLQNLTHHIQQDKQTLATYRLNQANLNRLLISLVRQSVLQTRHPFANMRKKLTKPIQAKHQLAKMNRGVVFITTPGTKVQAIYPGKVVFADWLNGYGLLLIVDHGWGFMTVYANNQALLKHKGELVNQGEQIATVGHSGGFKQNSLYFEIRHHGKAIPPLEWLSSK